MCLLCQVNFNYRSFNIFIRKFGTKFLMRFSAVIFNFQVKLEGRSLTGVKIRVTSKVRSKSNEIYGIREDVARGNSNATAACLEFRCR